VYRSNIVGFEEYRKYIQYNAEVAFPLPFASESGCPLSGRLSAFSELSHKSVTTDRIAFRINGINGRLRYSTGRKGGTIDRGVLCSEKKIELWLSE